MDMKNRTTGKTNPQVPVPAAVQIQVRTDVRSGSDLDTCKFNLNKWRDRYYYWYNVAHQAGRV